ncbi:hypothetical protein KCP78_01025 [Salmonella enterica subsp. enterica]|nr:hypothetical protein KCP78_01025 [Salmonella enterica subsp. enterica]
MTVRTCAAGDKPENGVFGNRQAKAHHTAADITKMHRGTEITLHLREGEDEFSMTGAYARLPVNIPIQARISPVEDF